MTHALLPIPFLLPYEGVAPVLHGPLRRCEPGCALLGRVTLGARAELRASAVLRADGHVVEVGDDFHLGERGTLHIAHAEYGTKVGHRVTVGNNAVVHACTVGDDCVVQDGALVLDGAVVGPGSVIAAGSVVSPRKELPGGYWYEGIPAVPVRPVDADTLARLHQEIRARPPADAAALPLKPALAAAPGLPAYVAATVTGAGTLRMGRDSSLWFGCHVDAPVHGLDIGEGANVQDNSLLRGSERPVVIGPDCTIGHNVALHDCDIGARTLIGMGSVVAPGTVVGEDVLLTAGSTTEPGQVLEAGWVWGGSPARPKAPMDERKRHMIEQAALIYRDYQRSFAHAQALLLAELAD